MTVAQVNEWFASYGRRTHSARANAYRLLTTVMKAAIDEGLRESNPCRVRGGGTDPRRAHDTEAATTEQVDALAAAMRPQWRMLVLLAAYCQLRFGELAELRRKRHGAGRRARRDPGAPGGDAGRRRDDGRAAEVQGGRAGRGDPAAPAARPGRAPGRARRAGPRRAAVHHAARRAAHQSATGASGTRPGRRRACRDSGSTTCGTPGRPGWPARARRLKERMYRPGTVIRGWRRGTSTPTPSGTRRTPSGSPAARRSWCRWPRAGRGAARRERGTRHEHRGR